MTIACLAEVTITTVEVVNVKLTATSINPGIAEYKDLKEKTKKEAREYIKAFYKLPANVVADIQINEIKLRRE